MPMTWGGKPAIWLTWTGSNPLPDFLGLCLASIRRHNGADFEVIVVTPENLRQYLDPHPAYEYLSLNHRSDYLRLWLLHRYGGIYLDMDTVGLRSLSGIYAGLSHHDIVTYDGAPWGAVMAISVFGPTRRDSVLTRGWSAAVENLLDRHHDDLAAYRARDPNPNSGGDCLGWAEVCLAQVEPIARQLADAGQLSIRRLEPTWARLVAGGEGYVDLFRECAPQLPDTDLLVLNNAMLPDAIRNMPWLEIRKSELGICRLLQHALGWNPLAQNGETEPLFMAEALADALPVAKASAADSSSTQSPTVTPKKQQRFAKARDQEGERRAIVCFVEDRPYLIQQVLALRLSLLYSQSPDTDLVVMGPKEALDRLPNDLVKIVQQPATSDPVWHNVHYVNAFASVNGNGAEQLNRYSHIMRTDVDTFITPAWNQFHPTNFTVGISDHVNDDNVQQRILAVAADYGLVHRGLKNINSTWYGPTAVVRRACALTEMLTKHLLTNDCLECDGEWPRWSRRFTTMYAGEIAVNHCASDAQPSGLLDASSTSPESVTRHAHIHCSHTRKTFSKNRFMDGGYSVGDADDLDLDIIRDYCLALSLLSQAQLDPSR
jgi:hypothetical protein